LPYIEIADYLTNKESAEPFFYEFVTAFCFNPQFSSL